jgi:AbrB family looped-hinge helix DNA binding protein
MASTTVTEKYQTTIPAEIREALGIEAGQKVEWYLFRGKAVLENVKKVKEPVKFLTGQVKLGKDAVDLVREARKGFE